MYLKSCTCVYTVNLHIHKICVSMFCLAELKTTRFGKINWSFLLVCLDILLRRLSTLEWPTVTGRQLGVDSVGQFGSALLISQTFGTARKMSILAIACRL